jgi:hypothetical protein
MTFTRQELAKQLDLSVSMVPEELADNINATINGDKDFAELFHENLLNYRNVAQDRSKSISKYVDSVKLVTYKLSGCSDYEAWKNTYPDRYERRKAKWESNGGREGTNQTLNEYCKGNYVPALRTEYVKKIMSQIQIPTKLLNVGLLQEAINVEADLMYNARSETVREKAAHTLIEYLGGDDGNKIELEIGYKKDSVIDQYEQAMKKMVEAQLAEIQKGGDIKQITNTPIIDVKAEDVK